MQKLVKTPGPDHPISLAPHSKRVRVKFNGCVVADTTRALAMHEHGYPTVLYIPRDDADASFLVRSDHTTYCPYKGDASYFSIRVGNRVSANAVWTYEAPYGAVAAIENFVAFYLNRVDSIEVGHA